MTNRPARLPEAVRAGLLLAGNVLPLVGVAFWGWNLAALLVLYGAEAVVTAGVAALKMLLAERVPEVPFAGADSPLRALREKRGGVRVREDWPPIYPRNLPHALGMAGSFLFVWCWVAVLALADVASAAAASLPPSVPLSALALAVARLAEFRTEYIGRGEYADVSARAAAATPARQTLLVVCLLPLLSAVGESRAAGTLLLVAVVAAKTLADAYGFWVDHLDRAPLRVGEWLFGAPETGDPPPTVDAPAAAPSVRVETDTPAVLFTGLVPVALAFASRPGLVVLLLIALAALAVGAWALLPGLVVVSLVAGACLLVHYLRFGTLEYQRRGGALVCHDTWLDEPQWACEIEEIRNPSADRRITSRLFGTTVVRFDAGTSGDESFRLGPVADADAVVERLGFPAFDPSQDEPNRQVAAAALGLAGSFLLVPVGLYFAPSVSTGKVIGVVVVLGPMMAVLVGTLLWVSLYNA
ncbi:MULTISPECIES: DUF6498-containing protein [Halorussus]|uniref:DUF6498-containing protein n=1 Tax=Halorussus TaxID=1070314 RepID=UPI000E211272|nr:MULTISPECIES: DUF6498-containing protein [Halorussus]NHN59642.1 hypothetical protein [Halorussus sp. JP-T4]